MSYERGEPDEFEIIWKSGHIDRLVAHQVTWPNNSIFSGESAPRIIRFHAEIDGRWTLMLSASEDEIATIRNVTQASDV